MKNLRVIDMGDPEKVLIPVPRTAIQELGLVGGDEVNVDVSIHNTIVITKSDTEDTSWGV